MGLDIQFNHTAAINAGLKLTMERNGSDESIARAEEHDEDQEYIDWLKKEVEVVEVPGTELRVINDGWEDSITIRANKWGRVYEPMTKWLIANNITWSEF